MSLFEYPFMVHALEAGTIVAVAAGVVGWFMVLRREAFAGHTLAVLSFPGAAAAALVGAPLAAGYYAFAGVGAVAIAVGPRTRAESPAVVGTVQAAGFALGFLFLGLYGGVLESLESLLFGSFLGITQGKVTTLLAVSAVAVGVLVVIARPLFYASVDEAGARARGIPVRALDLAFLLVLGVTVAATAQITGVLLVFALLVAPAAAAQQVTVRLVPGVLLSVAVGVVVAWGSLALAYYENHSVGFYVSVLAFGAFALARAGRALR